MRPFGSVAPLLCFLVSTSTTPLVGQVTAPRSASPSEHVSLIIRTDDGGMSHSVNMALERLIQTGLPLSVSVMFPTPWHQETVAILKRHPRVSVGVHLTLNSEWKHYRWGPVTGRSAVPSLVDRDGYFFPTSEALYRNRPAIAEIERELRAQIEMARQSGLQVDYLDFHMGTAVRYAEFRAVVERLAQEYGLGMSGYFGEVRHDPQYRASPSEKTDSLVAMTNRLKAQLNLVVTHVGIDDAELGALVDMNTDGGLDAMAKHRQGELDALTSSRFREALAARHVKLTTYREVVGQQGLKAMQRPVE